MPPPASVTVAAPISGRAAPNSRNAGISFPSESPIELSCGPNSLRNPSPVPDSESVNADQDEKSRFDIARPTFSENPATHGVTFASRPSSMSVILLNVGPIAG